MTVQRFQLPVMAQLLQADLVRRHLGGSSCGERGLGLGRAAPQEFVAVDGLFIQVMVSNLSALNRSLAEGVTRRSTVDDSANILARCTSTFSAGSLRASTSDFDSGMATGPSCDSGGTALQAVVRVNGLSSTLTASSLSDPSWSVVECVTDDGAVEEKIFWLPSVVRLLQRAFVRQRLAGFKKLTKTSFELEADENKL